MGMGNIFFMKKYCTSARFRIIVMLFFNVFSQKKKKKLFKIFECNIHYYLHSTHTEKNTEMRESYLNLRCVCAWFVYMYLCPERGSR